MRRRGTPCGRVAGIGLLEVLVALSILATVIGIALTLFAAARSAFRSAESRADRQQSTRVAFDRLSDDIRLAGFNRDPDRSAPAFEEAIEGAWETAITIRADFDFTDSAARAEPESDLSAGTGRTVTTGNDEIVTYVLARPGLDGEAAILLRLDPDRPRSGTVRSVIIPNLVLVQDDPPYTLYRVTLADVPGAFPGAPQPRSSFIFEPVADDLRSLVFSYHDDAGNRIGPATPEDPGDDLGGLDGAAADRARIRSVRLTLSVMSREADPVDARSAGLAGAAHPRTFELRSFVMRRNP